MSKSFTLIPISEIRVKLTKLKRQVQFGHKRIVITCYGEAVGFLLPLDDLSPEKGLPIKRTEEMPLTKFREQLTETKELLESGIDCVYLTFHTRRVIVFVSCRLACYLPIPHIDTSQKVLLLNDN